MIIIIQLFSEGKPVIFFPTGFSQENYLSTSPFTNSYKLYFIKSNTAKPKGKVSHFIAQKCKTSTHISLKTCCLAMQQQWSVYSDVCIWTYRYWIRWHWWSVILWKLIYRVPVVMTINTCMYCTYHCVCMCVCVCTHVRMYVPCTVCQKVIKSLQYAGLHLRGAKEGICPPPRKQDGPWAMLCVLLPIIRLVTQNYVAMWWLIMWFMNWWLIICGSWINKTF